MNNAQAFVFAAFLCLAVSAFALITVGPRGTDTLNGFILARRELKQGSILASLTASNAALANIVFLYAYWGYTYGAAAVVWGAAFWGVGLLVFLLALQKGRLSELLRPGQPALGLNEILGQEFKRSRLVTAVVAIASGITFLFLLSLEVGVGSNAAIRLISDSPTVAYGFSLEGLLIGGALVSMVSAYGYIGGFSMVVRTDIWQLVLVIIGLAAAVALCNSLLVPKDTNVLDLVRSRFVSGTYFAWNWTLAPFVIGSLFSWGVWFICTADSWQRALAAAPSEEKRIRPVAIGLGIVLLIYVSAVSSVIGMTVRELWANPTPPAYPVIEFIAAVRGTIPDNPGNGFLVAIVMAGFLAAMASTVDTYMVIVGQCLGGDLRRSKPLSTYVGTVEERKVLQWVRMVGIVAPVVGLGAFAAIHLVGRQNNFTLYMLAGSVPMSLVPVSAWVIWGRMRSNIALHGGWTASGILVAVALSMIVNYELASDALTTFNARSFGLLYFVPALAVGVAGLFLLVDLVVSSRSPVVAKEAK